MSQKPKVRYEYYYKVYPHKMETLDGRFIFEKIKTIMGMFTDANILIHLDKVAVYDRKFSEDEIYEMREKFGLCLTGGVRVDLNEEKKRNEKRSKKDRAKELLKAEIEAENFEEAEHLLAYIKMINEVENGDC